MSELITPAAATPAETPAAQPAATPAPEFSWKNQLDPDFANSPTMQKYPDTRQGFNDAAKAHLSLQQMMGHDKVVVPKGPDDQAGWSMFQKAMGIPDKAELYGLPDADVPQELKQHIFDKNKFAELMHAHKQTPAQAKGLWEAFVAAEKEGYRQAVEKHTKAVQDLQNQLRGKWGDGYEGKIQLGQEVINRFAGDQDAQDWVTAQILKDPRGAEFLAKIGEQFSENKVGTFGAHRFSLTPQEAQDEINAIMSNKQHPYLNDKAPHAARQAAIDRVNSLYAIINKAKS